MVQECVAIGVSLDLPDQEACTCLHRACASDRADVIRMLLDAGCDPARKDARGRVPSSLCSKAHKEVFREFRADNPEAEIDWSLAQVPEPVTDEQKERQREKKREKNKKARARQQEAKKAAAEQEQSRISREATELLVGSSLSGWACHVCTYNNHTLRQTCQMCNTAKSAPLSVAWACGRCTFLNQPGIMLCATCAAPPSAVAPVPVAEEAVLCAFCAQAVRGSPFCRLEFKYCSVPCVHRHKAQLEGSTRF
eukprot:TRINITY_DN8475_c0_g1_i1.p1 TRINITY_DN8475_c0_g1~~TRINITY_DN8475_c0_g1_i1.p1  ORF type:complete len:252 (+),score=72.16 TRINITY_DN8475_c0_g1_i1:1364-2119(+)